MASQLFNARGGISVGLTGTSVISETGFGTFPVGISAAGATFTGDIAVNGGDITTTASSASLFNSTTNLDILNTQTAGFTLNIGNASSFGGVKRINIGGNIGGGASSIISIGTNNSASNTIIFGGVTLGDGPAGSRVRIGTSNTAVNINGESIFSRLSTFNAGITASGATFMGKVNAIQGVVSGYTRLEWCGLTSGFDIIPTGWANMSAPITTSPTANDAYFAPIFIANRIRITAIGHQNGSGGGGNTGSFMVGLYDSDDYGYPRNRLYGSAATTLSTGSFTTQRVTGVNTTVNPGQYWLAITFGAAGLTAIGRLGARMKWMTPTSGSPIGQNSVDGLRRPQGGFTLAATQGTTFANVEGPANPCIFYNGEFI